MIKEQRINRVIAGLSHYGYTTDIERGEAKLLIKDLQQEIDYYKNIVEEIKNIFNSPDEHFEDGCSCKLIEDKLEELEKGNNYE